MTLVYQKAVDTEVTVSTPVQNEVELYWLRFIGTERNVYLAS